MKRLLLAALATLMIGGTAMAQPARVAGHQPGISAARHHQPMQAHRPHRHHHRHAALHQGQHGTGAVAAGRAIRHARHV